MTYTTDGRRILRDGTAVTVLGVNYHPSRAGCQLWVDWDPAALAEDFRLMAAAGLDTVRLFVFWRDFQPSGPDTVSAVALERLTAAVSLARDAGLACVVSLLTLWMNGQVLDLSWRRGRDLWRDPLLRDAQLRLARSVALALCRLPNVLGYDLGDELWHVAPDQARTLTRSDVAGWQGDLAQVLRETHPGVLVMQANDAGGVFGGTPFGSDNSAGLDLVATHGYPTWAPASIESTLSYKATQLPAYLARVGGAYGVALVDELGSYGVGEEIAAAYLGAAAASALANGAAGVLSWCWQDLVAAGEPYDERPTERGAGLHRADGRPKPAMSALSSVIAALPDLSLFPPPAPVALYLGQRVRGGSATYLDTAGSAVAAFYAYLLAKRAHLPVDVTAGDPVGRRLVLCPSATRLTRRDLDRLEAAARLGATVYLSLGDHLHAFAGEQLTGAEIVDFGPAEGKTRLGWAGQEWPIDWATGGARPTTLRPTTAEVLARYEDGTAAVVVNAVGRGRIVFCNAPFEAQLDRPGRLTQGRAHGFYERLAALAGVPPTSADAHPDLEVVEEERAGRRRAVLINHGQQAVPVPRDVGPVNTGTRPALLAPKEWCVLAPAGRRAQEGVSWSTAR